MKPEDIQKKIKKASDEEWEFMMRHDQLTSYVLGILTAIFSSLLIRVLWELYIVHLGIEYKIGLAVFSLGILAFTLKWAYDRMSLYSGAIKLVRGIRRGYEKEKEKHE